MSSISFQRDEAGPWVKILDQVDDYRFGDLFRIARAKLQYRRFDRRTSDPVTRINFERGDSVGVLLYHPEDDAVILVREFRYPVYASFDPDKREGDGAWQAWLPEIVAGVKDVGRTVNEMANKELLGEAGYKVKGDLQPITTIYPSPWGHLGVHPLTSGRGGSPSTRQQGWRYPGRGRGRSGRGSRLPASHGNGRAQRNPRRQDHRRVAVSCLPQGHER